MQQDHHAWWNKKAFTFSITRNDLLIWILAIVGVWALYHSIDFDRAVLGIRR